MRNGRDRPDEFEPPSGQLVTDSMVLAETFVDSAIRGQRVSLSEDLKPAQGLVKGLFFGLLFWLLMLLLFTVF